MKMEKPSKKKRDLIGQSPASSMRSTPQNQDSQSRLSSSKSLTSSAVSIDKSADSEMLNGSGTSEVFRVRVKVIPYSYS